MALNYHITQPRVHLPPAFAPVNEGMPVYPISIYSIPAKSQKVISTGIQLAIPAGYLASILGVEHPSPREPLVCPGILNPAYDGELSLLVGNLTDGPLVLDLKIPFAHV